MHRLTLLANTITNSSSTTSKTILEKKDGIATIWLNSPKDLNCLSVAMTN